MEEINIAEILKDKPINTKLYSPAYGSCLLVYPEDYAIRTKSNKSLYFYDDGRLDILGETMLFPSKKMRDWSKFAWKKGDVLSCGVDNLCIFEKWCNDDYTEFEAKFANPNYSGNTFKTEKWSKETNEAVIKQYISNIEEFKGGKLNLTTLEIEKQPEFKDGDIVVYGKSVAICRKIYKPTLYFYVSIDETFGLLFDDNCVSAEEYRLATGSEKQQLFAALEKEGKRWDADKKQLVDLSKKCEFKPFDKVLVRDTKDEFWRPAFFASLDEHCITEYAYGLIGDPEGVFCKYCIPYNEETAHLIGTTDEWKGGK